MITKRIPCVKEVGDLRIKFSGENAIHLELPTEPVGGGWKLVPFANPEVSDIIYN